MTDVIRLPDIEPDNWEIIEIALLYLIKQSDDTINAEIKKLAKFTLGYLRAGVKTY